MFDQANWKGKDLCCKVWTLTLFLEHKRPLQAVIIRKTKVAKPASLFLSDLPWAGAKYGLEQKYFKFKLIYIHVFKTLLMEIKLKNTLESIRNK